MKTIKFSKDYKVNAANGAKYKAGQVVQLPEASARHFVGRGLAEYTVKPAAKNLKINEPATKAKKIKKLEDPVPEPDRAAIAKRVFTDI